MIMALSDIFRGKLTVVDAIKEWNGEQLTIVTAGDPPPNASELLGSKKMSEILNDLKAHADVVIIDGPPFLVADATTLAAKVDGVLVVVRWGIREPAVVHATAAAGSDTRVLGLVNRIRRRRAYGGINITPRITAWRMIGWVKSGNSWLAGPDPLLHQRK
jgi:Mrp family chromosome partitioning ATPase